LFEPKGGALLEELRQVANRPAPIALCHGPWCGTQRLKQKGLGTAAGLYALGESVMEQGLTKAKPKGE
jgi:hypothetical protein